MEFKISTFFITFFLELEDYYPLYLPKVMLRVMGQASNLSPVSLNLQNNYLKDINSIYPLNKRELESVDLRNNNVSKVNMMIRVHKIRTINFLYICFIFANVFLWVFINCQHLNACKKQNVALNKIPMLFLNLKLIIIIIKVHNYCHNISECFKL